MAQTNSGVGSQGPKILYRRKSYGRQMWQVDMSFPTNGSSNPVAASVKGRLVASVTRSGTGTYLVTLNDYWAIVVGVFARLNLATPTKQRAMFVGKPSLSAAQTFSVKTIDSDTGAAVDVAAAAGNEVHLKLWLSTASFGGA